MGINREKEGQNLIFKAKCAIIDTSSLVKEEMEVLD